MQLLRVVLKKSVGHIVDLPLGLGGFRGVGNAQGQNHLIFPQRDGVDQGGLDFLHHDGVVVLDHADLGSRLDGDGPSQLQVVDFLLKPVALFGKIPGGLSILG